MFKRIISVMICVVMVAAMFAGCATRKPKTFREAAEAGETFLKSEGVKDVKLTVDYSGKKFVAEGQYDHKAEKGVFSLKLDLDDTTHTFKDMIVLSGGKLYIKVPDLSQFGGMFGMSGMSDEDRSVFDEVTYGAFDEEDPGSDVEDFTKADIESMLAMTDEELESLGMSRLSLNAMLKLFDESGKLDYTKIYDLSDEEFKAITGMEKSEMSPDDFFGYDDDEPMSGLPFGMLGELGELTGKYVAIKLPENKPEKLIKIFEDAEAKAYEKLQKLDAEEDYPYVVKFTKEDAKDLLISVMDSLKAGKSDVSAELAAIAAEYLGSDLVKKIEEMNENGDKLKNMIEKGLDEMFKETDPSDIDVGEDDDFDCVLKSAYQSGKKYECVSRISVGKGEERDTIKITCSVTAAESSDGFTERCGVSEKDSVDIFKNLRDMFSEMMKQSEIHA